MAYEHRFQARLEWAGSTTGGYTGYERSHQVATPPVAAELALSAAPAFRGDADRRNPEQLVLAAASSCQLLSFLACAARAGIEVCEYADDAEALMPVTREPMRITRITLRPRITVAPGTDHSAVRQAVAQGHDECFIANSLRSEIVVEPTIETVGSRSGRT